MGKAVSRALAAELICLALFRACRLGAARRGRHRACRGVARRAAGDCSRLQPRVANDGLAAARAKPNRPRTADQPAHGAVPVAGPAAGHRLRPKQRRKVGRSASSGKDAVAAGHRSRRGLFAPRRRDPGNLRRSRPPITAPTRSARRHHESRRHRCHLSSFGLPAGVVRTAVRPGGGPKRRAAGGGAVLLRRARGPRPSGRRARFDGQGEGDRRADRIAGPRAGAGDGSGPGPRAGGPIECTGGRGARELANRQFAADAQSSD